jgi:membrane-associated phospholipid phosphatase
MLNGRQIWLISGLVSAAVTTLSFKFVDVPIAWWVAHYIGYLSNIGIGFGSAIILSLEAAAAIALVFVRLMRGHLSPFREALALASLASMCAYAVNDGVLKLLFGVPNPGSVLLQGVNHAFHLFAGSQDSSFPSGHMVLAGAFGGVFMKLYPSSMVALSVLLAFGAILLIFGDWHFASDVIAGTYLGVSAGVLAGKLWQVHSN